VGLDDPLDHVERDAHALDHMSAAGADLVGEDQRLLVAGDAGARVGDGEQGGVVLCFGTDGDRSALGGELHRVGHDAREDLDDPVLVAEHQGGRILGDLARELDALALGDDTHRAHRRIDDWLDLLRRAIEDEAPGLDPPAIVEVIEDLVELLGGVRNRVHKAARRVFGLDGARQHGRAYHDHAERISQIMRQGFEEFGFDVLRLFPARPERIAEPLKAAVFALERSP
jgi:hypothetical protein